MLCWKKLREYYCAVRCAGVCKDNGCDIFEHVAPDTVLCGISEDGNAECFTSLTLLLIVNDRKLFNYIDKMVVNVSITHKHLQILTKLRNYKV